MLLLVDVFLTVWSTLKDKKHGIGREYMESTVYIILGYIAWCCVAFLVARLMKIENANHKAISLVYVLAAAPLVLIDYIKGIGSD